MLAANTLFILLLSGGGVLPDGAANTAAADFSRDLSESGSVSIYYISRTGKYSYAPEEIRKKSSVLIRRQCGGNCSRLMAPVVQHLREAAPMDCQPGQESVLIELDGRPSVVYSQNGRAIRYKGKCYFNRTNVNQKIKDAEIVPS